MNLLKNSATKYLRRRGYVVSKVPVEQTEDGYSLYRYSDYDDYRQTQIAGNKRKIRNVFADETTIGLISDYIRPSNPRRALCHGSRNGAEVRWFEQNLSIDIVGTDISDTAPDHGLVQWDFHEPRPEWVGQFDFVYTNSHDHAYDPEKALSTWVEQLAPGGCLFLEHTVQHGIANQSKLDPLAIEPHVLPFAVLRLSEGRFAVTDVIAPDYHKGGSRFYVFVIRRQTDSSEN